MPRKFKIGKDIINIKIDKWDDIVINKKSISVKDTRYGSIHYNFSGFGDNPRHNLQASKTQKESLLMILNICKELADTNDMRSFLVLGPNLEIIDIGTDW